MKEEFKHYFPEHTEAAYIVSNYGYVRSLLSEKIVNQVKSTGYRYFTYVQSDGKRKVQYIAPLVVKLFKRKPTKYSKQVIYKDGDKSNCRADNVMWATLEYYLRTRKVNIADMGQKGRDPAYRLFTDRQVRNIRKLEGTNKDIAKKYKVNFQVIYALRKGITYSSVK